MDTQEISPLDFYALQDAVRASRADSFLLLCPWIPGGSLAFSRQEYVDAAPRLSSAVKGMEGVWCAAAMLRAARGDDAPFGLVDLRKAEPAPDEDSAVKALAVLDDYLRRHDLYKKYVRQLDCVKLRVKLHLLLAAPTRRQRRELSHLFSESDPSALVGTGVPEWQMHALTLARMGHRHLFDLLTWNARKNYLVKKL